MSPTRTLDADVCVIGAGAGGAVLAAELAEGGARVVVLEQGARHDPDGFTAQPMEMMARLYRDGGQTVTLGAPPVLLPLGRGLGGTTLVNSGTCFRTPAHVLQRWRSEHGLELDEGELDRCFARVERALSVAEVTPELAGANAAVARRGAERLGWSHGYLRRNARGCVGSGVCAFGCPTSAKQHTGITYLPRAEAAGATILTGADVRSILVAGGRALGVRARLGADARLVSGGSSRRDAGRGGVGGDDTDVGDMSDLVRDRMAAEESTLGGQLEVRAPHVVVAAGTVHTPLLLARSGLGAASGQLGRNLVLHPATAAFALMDEVVDMARGVPQSFYVDEFASEGIMFEGVAGPPAYAALALPLTGARHAAAMANYRHLAQFGLMVSDSSRGSVRVIGAPTPGSPRRGRMRYRRGMWRAPPLIRYDLVEDDVAKFRAGLARMEQLFRAAGAREVYLPLPPGVAPERARARDLKLMAFHPLGTARANADPARGVLDPDLRVHGVEGLHVADGSVMPSSLGVNPQITIMALATRLAYHLLGRMVPNTPPVPDILPVTDTPM
ncbi:MAG TPA: GMC family oxidoreductase [Solirubrobacteraceae bacterium]|nr:GMC family oxidoreductase [Solirubrobacteraceae bacterium]